jgi:hypothetical protein
VIQFFGIIASVVKYTAITEKVKFPFALHKGIWRSGIMVAFVLNLEARWR